MLNIMKLNMYPFFTKQVSVPTNDPTFYNVIFVSENQDFISTYPSLNIRRQFVKKVTVFPNKSGIPRLIVTVKELLPYKEQLGLIPVFQSDRDNVFIDTTPFFDKVDLVYQKGSYRRPAVLAKIINYLNSAKSFAGNKSILMYHVNLSKEIPEMLVERRSIILAMISKVGNGSFPFDSVILAVEKDGSMKFFSIYNVDKKSLAHNKIYSILNSLTSKEIDVQQDELPEKEETQPGDEKRSILNAIQQYQKKKIVTS